MSVLRLLNANEAHQAWENRKFDVDVILEDDLPGKLPNSGDEGSDDDPNEEELLAAEAKEKGITVDQLKEQKETELLEAEAKEKGITVEELKEQKEQEALDAEEAELKKEADSRGITVDQLLEEKETERLSTKAKELGKTVEEVKALEAEEAAKAEEDIFKMDDESGKPGDDDKENIFTDELVSNLEGIVLGEGEKLTSENLKDIWNKSIAAAKQKFDLSNQSEQVIAVVEHLNAHGDLMDFYSNPTIREADRFLALSNEQKFTEVNMDSLIRGGMEESEAKTLTAERLSSMSEEDLKKLVEGYDNEIKAIRNIEINRVSSKSKEFRERNKLNSDRIAQAERDSIIKMVEKMDSYRGLKISPEAKTSIIDAIKSGRFLDVINKSSAQAKLTAFMELQFGAKIDARIKDTKTGKTDYKRGFQKAAEKTFGKKPPVHKTGSERRDENLQGFDAWKELEKES